MKLTASLVILVLLVACCWANRDLKKGFEVLQQCYKASSISDDVISRSKEMISKYVRSLKPGDRSETQKTKLEQDLMALFRTAGVEDKYATVSDCMKSNMSKR